MCGCQFISKGSSQTLKCLFQKREFQEPGEVTQSAPCSYVHIIMGHGAVICPHIISYLQVLSLPVSAGCILQTP